MYRNFIIQYLSEAQHVSGDTPPIIRSLKLHWQPLVFHTWKVVGRVVGGPTTRPTTFNIWKTRGCQYSFRLLMMGSVSPETFWASNKYGIIKILIRCWILLHFLMNCTVLHGSSNIKSSASVSGLRIEIWTRELWNKKHRHYCQVHGPVTSTVVRNAFVTLISTKKIWFPFWDISDYEIF